MCVRIYLCMCPPHILYILLYMCARTYFCMCFRIYYCMWQHPAPAVYDDTHTHMASYTASSYTAYMCVLIYSMLPLLEMELWASLGLRQIPVQTVLQVPQALSRL